MSLLVAVFFFILVTAVLGWLALAFWVETRWPRIICLMYHRLVTRAQHQTIIGPERLYALPSPEFERQVRWLKRAGYRFVGPAEVVQVVQGIRTPSGPEVLITFDDGCRSVWSLGMPILKRHGVPAVVFVTTDSTSTVFASGDSNQAKMTDEQLVSLSLMRIEIHSHTVTHRPLVTLPDDELEMELRQSQRVLEDTAGASVKYLSIPGNWFDERVQKVASLCGYEGVWCSNPGTVCGARDAYEIPRLNVDGDLTLRQFAWTISSTGVVWCRIVASAKRLIKYCAGYSGWMNCRQHVLSCLPGANISKRRAFWLAFATVCALALVALGLFIVLLCRYG